MNNFKSEPNFVSAALRHIRDAEHLCLNDINQSRDQAWHLAGFAHECARKAFISDSWIPKLLGHDFSGASEQIVELAVCLDPRASRHPVRDWADNYKIIKDWHPNHRYERTGTSDNRDVEKIIHQGREAVDNCIISLFY